MFMCESLRNYPNNSWFKKHHAQPITILFCCPVCAVNHIICADSETISCFTAVKARPASWRSNCATVIMSWQCFRGGLNYWEVRLTGRYEGTECVISSIMHCSLNKAIVCFKWLSYKINTKLSKRPGSGLI